MSPMQLAVRAVFDFLVERGYHCLWGSGDHIVPGEEFICKQSPLPGEPDHEKGYSPELLRDMFRVMASRGDIVVIPANIRATLSSSRQMIEDVGGRFFELANPRCFDLIVGHMEGVIQFWDRVDKHVLDGGCWLVNGDGAHVTGWNVSSEYVEGGDV